MASSDEDALDALLNIQLKLVGQQIQQAQQSRGGAPASKQPDWQRDMAANQVRLAALDEQNAGLEREWAEAQAARRRAAAGARRNGPARPAPAAAQDDELKKMLRQSVEMHQTLMEDVRAEKEEKRQRRWEYSDLEASDDEDDFGMPQELLDVLDHRTDAQASFGGNLPAQQPFQPPPPAQPPLNLGQQPVARGPGRASDRSAAPPAAEQMREELLDEIETALAENAVSSDSEAEPEAAAARRKPGSAPSESSSRPPRTGEKRGETPGADSEEEEEEEEEAAEAEDEVRSALQAFFESATAWLKRAVRPVVSSIVRDPSLKLDVWTTEAMRGGAFSRLRGRPSGVPKPVDVEKAMSKLQIRTKALLEVIIEAIPEAPGGMLSHLSLLTTKRFLWPEGALLPSVKRTLELRTDGTAAPTDASPVAVVLQLLLVRVVCEELLLRPRENQLAAKLPPQPASNLKMLASVLFALFEMCLGKTTDPSRLPELFAAEELRFEGGALPLYYSNPQRFQPQLDRVCELALPELEAWLEVAPAMLSTFATLLLKEAEARRSRTEQRPKS